MRAPVPTRSPRLVLWLAAAAVAFAAADTYVVVLALPDMMTGIGLSVDQLQRAAPLLSGFLLGYVAILPLIGRLADLLGQVPVLVAGLVVFAVGSFLTAMSWDLATMVVGRFLQGLGGGALVPATLALVATLYPTERRGVPLGIVSAVQELGSVLGPLVGAVVLALAGWRAIFFLNLLVGVVLALLIRRLATFGRRLATFGRRAVTSGEAGSQEVTSGRPKVTSRRTDLVGLLLLVVTVAAYVLIALSPATVKEDITWGTMYVPLVGSSDWLTPLGLVVILGAVGFVVRCWFARRPLVDVRHWARSARQVDLVGALLIAIMLGGVILAFATADPQVQVFSAQGRWYLVAAGLALVGLVVHLRRTSDPIIPAGAFRRTPAWGSVVVSFFIGAALVAALIDVPLFARTTVYGDSQVKAALVLMELLVALPVGAVAGGFLTRRLPAGLVAGVGMLLAALAFVAMSRWDADALHGIAATLALVLGGLGFGLALAPVNASVLATTARDVHGLTTSLTVVARMVGMLVGISALTTIGLRSYYAAQADLPPMSQVCDGKGLCEAFKDLLVDAAISQEHTVFAGAAISAGIAAVLALVLFRGAPTRAVSAREIVALG